MIQGQERILGFTMMNQDEENSIKYKQIWR